MPYDHNEYDSDDYWPDSDGLEFWDEAIKVHEDNISPHPKYVPSYEMATPLGRLSRDTFREREKPEVTYPLPPRNVGPIYRTNMTTVTPPKSSAPGTPQSRSSHIRNAFKALRVRSDEISPLPSPTRPKLNKGKTPLRVIVIESDEEEEVVNMLTDTELSAASTPFSSYSDTGSSTTSMSSVFSSLYPDSYPSRKRDSDSRESPLPSPTFPSPKVRKVLTYPQAQTHVPQPHFDKRDRQSVSQVSRPTLPDADDIFQSPLAYSKISLGGASPHSASSRGIWRSPDHTFDPFIIAHSQEVQLLMDEARISWGVQYELARGVTTKTWTWSEVSEKLPQLRGSNANVAYRVGAIMRERPLKTAPNLSIWRELDREQAAILENRSRGLGLMGEWHGDPDWHGGQVQQIARLVKEVKSQGAYTIRLEPLEKRRSHHFARFLGSRRVLQLRIPDDLIMEELGKTKKFLSRKFILCGRVYVPFYSKDKNSLYMVETDENWQRSSDPYFGDQHRISFQTFGQWHNPPELNANQPIAKYSTRIAIGFSNSIPAIIFDEENMHFIDDIYASDWLPEMGKAPAHKIMTDGCGFINVAAMLTITYKLKYPSLPAAVQGRIAGAKGVWILHPEDRDPTAPPRIWIRDSQNKIKYPQLGRAHRILNLLCVSRPSPTCNLSMQSILNLAHNGVPDGALVSLLIKGLEDDVKPLMDWKKPHAMAFLWDAINKMGHFSGARTQRLAAGSSRALGFQGRDWGHSGIENRDDQDIIEDADNAAYSGRNDYSGAPLALNELVAEMVQAGFLPTKSNLLNAKLRQVVKNAIDSSVGKYHIAVQESVGALVVPDPLGVLEKGEIYYRSSQPLKNPVTEMFFDVLTGDVIVGRYPIRLASDIQKVTAVNYPSLYNWPDVIIVSTKGSSSPASLLSGGDCDGDDLFLIWEPLVVKHFRNTPFVPPPKNFLEDNFEREVESVTAFTQRTEALPAREAELALQDILLLGLGDSKVGLYSKFHDNSIWANGLADPETVRLGYMFNTLLDASKTGLRVKPNIFSKDRRRFDHTAPWVEPSKFLTRRPILGNFILETLLDAGKRQGSTLLCEYESNDLDRNFDSDLLQPFRDAQKRANDASAVGFHKLKEELEIIMDHVTEAHMTYGKACRGLASNSSSFMQATPAKKPRRDPNKPAKAKDDPLYALTMHFHDLAGIYFTTNVDEIKASYAYSLSEKFAFAVAFKSLCTIKARAGPGGIAPSLRLFDEVKTIPSSVLRALTRNDDDRF